MIATADSVNMSSEIAATGRPAYVFYPAGGTPKFNRFHQALQASSAVRQLPDHFVRLETWAYAPLDAASAIAAEIERRVAAHRSSLNARNI